MFSRVVLALNFDSNFSKANSELWLKCWISLVNFMKIWLVVFEKWQQRTNQPTISLDHTIPGDISHSTWWYITQYLVIYHTIPGDISHNTWWQRLESYMSGFDIRTTVTTMELSINWLFVSAALKVITLCGLRGCTQSRVFETLKRAKVEITRAESINDAVLLIRCETFFSTTQHSSIIIVSIVINLHL